MKDPTIVRKELNFIYHLYDSCNLNCKGCDHFSPISKPGFPSVEKCEKEFKRFSEIMGDSITVIGLMGGEPLLNPEAGEYLVIARKYFPKARIRLVTNGSLLDRQNEEFWRICRDNRIVIEYTKYPVKGIDYGKRRKIAQEHGVEIHSYDGDRDAYIKDLYFEPLDLTGSQDVEQTFKGCTLANYCIQLLDGRLYTCTPAANIFRLSDRYGLGIYPAPEDSLDIFEEGLTREKVAKFLASPIPLCRFCDLERRSFGHPWRQSQSTVYEYLPFFLDVRAENEMKSYKNVLLFSGGGQYASLVMKWLLNFWRRDCLRVCTNKEDRERPENLFGVKVENFSEVEASMTSQKKKRTAVLVAAPKKCQIELERMLVERGFEHVYLVDAKSLDEKIKLAALAHKESGKKIPACAAVSEEKSKSDGISSGIGTFMQWPNHTGARRVFWGVKGRQSLYLQKLLLPYMDEDDFFVDEDESLCGKMVQGLPVLGINSLKELAGKVFVVVLTGDFQRAQKKLARYGYVENVDYIDGKRLLT